MPDPVIVLGVALILLGLAVIATIWIAAWRDLRAMRRRRNLLAAREWAKETR